MIGTYRLKKTKLNTKRPTNSNSIFLDVKGSESKTYLKNQTRKKA